MKKIPFLLSDYFPPKKCGKDPFTAILGGITGLGSSSISAASSAADRRSIERENEKDRKFNHDEAELQRNWSSQQWDKQFKAQTEEAYKMYDYSNEKSMATWLEQQEYYSPVQQVQRLRNAGLNPALADGNASGVSGMSPAPPSTPSPSTPSGASASTSSNAPVAASSFASSFGSISQGLSDMVRAITEGDKNSVESKRLRATLEPFIENLVEDTNLKRSQTAINDFDLSFKKGTKDDQINLLREGFRKLQADIQLVHSQDGFVQAQTKLQNAYEVLTNAQARLTDKQFDMAVKVLNNLDALLEGKVRYYNSAANVNQANAGYLSQQAINVAFWNGINKESRDAIITQITSEALSASNDAFVSTETNKSRIKQINAYADMAKYAEDNKEVAFWTEVIVKGVGSLANLAGEVTKFKSFKSLSDSQQQRVQNEIRRIEQDARPRRTTTHRSKQDDGSVVTDSWSFLE